MGKDVEKLVFSKAIKYVTEDKYLFIKIRLSFLNKYV